MCKSIPGMIIGVPPPVLVIDIVSYISVSLLIFRPDFSSGKNDIFIAILRNEG